MNKNQIFLGKNGKTFGPFTEDEFQELMKQGRLAEYSWIWDHQKSTWKTLDQPPPTPVETSQKLSTAAKKAADHVSSHWESVRGILYNAFSLLEGNLKSVTETGCRFVCKDPHSDLSCGTWVSLNLYSPEINHGSTSIKVVAKILALEADPKGGWSYLLRWDSLPSL
ncbi:MAG: hypothetical protein HYX41_01965 [Bdellovibrio sp.]|nr:hypothetical protein [Bdellovibrio sp.]